MIDINNFDAIEISLASSKQIRSWSSGEVTKPETINYRTLKPEKDGLFCERIFGPTKDWECYCGKYKRVRFKGIVCDKCGVEVARSKVRRERMGHIELASPVSHIWYFKGTPSRIGLLLDLSPRNLERILYFALYVVTHIDEGGRQQELMRLDEELMKLEQNLDEQVVEQIDSLKTRRDTESLDIHKRLSDAEQEIRERREREIKRAEELESETRAMLREHMGQEAEDDVLFASDRVIARQGEVIKPKDLETLERVSEVFRNEIAENAQHELEDLHKQIEGEERDVRDGYQGQIDTVQVRLESQRVDRRQRLEQLKRDLEGLKKMDLIQENRYRELRDAFGTNVFRAGMGAEAVRELIADIDLDKLSSELRHEIGSTVGQRRKKATKRLKVVEAFRESNTSPEWMILTVLPVLPPELRPMVQLDGGRFATSDLNDLYRRVINRNNRLKRLLDLGAPEIIIRNEKRMLQEACDALIDNGRRGRAVAGSGNHKLKSLSDMLKGKQGRFRQNLLGKRVDYSGRSVIVVGPDLKLHQCGLPKRMALELFKPCIMSRLVERKSVQNIKAAKKYVDSMTPEVWDVLEEVIAEHPVLLNRAPTLHRLGIQAFEPVLVEGKAIQVHPLVCHAFNADFDGDQMAVHLPLSAEAQAEARILMLSSNNILSPAHGAPLATPSQDMVLGAYYLTYGPEGDALAKIDPATHEPRPHVFRTAQEAEWSYEHGVVKLHDLAEYRSLGREGGHLLTTVGRIIYNDKIERAIAEALGQEFDPSLYEFVNRSMKKKDTTKLVDDLVQAYGSSGISLVLDAFKDIGFEYATRAGVTISKNDVQTPPDKREILARYEAQLMEIESQYDMGMITEEERHEAVTTLWNKATDEVGEALYRHLDELNPIFMMANSGARGSFSQIRQLAGMRGLMANPKGEIIERPIKANFMEGLTVLEYFISTHGARKGLADTALRTADSGYLTRRLVDVSQDVIIRQEDCGTEGFIEMPVSKLEVNPETRALRPTGEANDNLIGRFAAEDIKTKRGRVIVEQGKEIDRAELADLVEAWGEDTDKGKVIQVKVRSVRKCEAPTAVCQACYGRSMASGNVAQIGDAVGIIAAQSI